MTNVLIEVKHQLSPQRLVYSSSFETKRGRTTVQWKHHLIMKRRLSGQKIMEKTTANIVISSNRHKYIIRTVVVFKWRATSMWKTLMVWVVVISHLCFKNLKTEEIFIKMSTIKKMLTILAFQMKWPFKWKKFKKICTIMYFGWCKLQAFCKQYYSRTDYTFHLCTCVFLKCVSMLWNSQPLEAYWLLAFAEKMDVWAVAWTIVQQRKMLGKAAK